MLSCWHADMGHASMLTRPPEMLKSGHAVVCRADLLTGSRAGSEAGSLVACCGVVMLAHI